MEAVQADVDGGRGSRRSDSPGDRNPSDDGTPARTTAAYLGGPDAGGDGDGGDDPGWRAWLLVVATFVAFLVVPGVILVLPAARPAIAAFGLTYRDAYLVLPLLPALVLAGLAVWAGVANRRR